MTSSKQGLTVQEHTGKASGLGVVGDHGRETGESMILVKNISHATFAFIFALRLDLKERWRP